MYAPLKLYLQITVTDTKTGKVIRRTRKRLCHSFVLQFLQLFEVSIRHAFAVAGDIISIKDTGNVARSIQASTLPLAYATWAIDCPEDDDTYGIVVGSDNTAEANTDYKIITQIADGAAAGELDYSAHTFTTSAEVGANVDLKIQRPFINNSGGNVTIEEAGIYTEHNDTSAAARFFCIVRDTTGTVTVADGQTATISFTFRTTV